MGEFAAGAVGPGEIPQPPFDVVALRRRRERGIAPCGVRPGRSAHARSGVEVASTIFPRPRPRNDPAARGGTNLAGGVFDLLPKTFTSPETP